MTHCTKCSARMNPVERMLGPICGACVRRAHAAATGSSASRGNPGRRWRRSAVQTLLFPRAQFTAANAQRWARGHGFSDASPDVTDEYVRLRQRDPDEFVGGRMRTIELGGGGVKAVVGEPRR